MTALNVESFEPFKQGRMTEAFMHVVGKMVSSVVEFIPGGRH